MKHCRCRLRPPAGCAAGSRHGGAQGFPGLERKEFLRRAEQNVEALNAATAGIPLSACACTSVGQLRGTARFRYSARKSDRYRPEARPTRLLFEAANPRHEHEWIVWRDARCRRQGSGARPYRHLFQLCRTPRADRASIETLCSSCRRGNASSPHRIAGSGPLQAMARSIDRGPGRSFASCAKEQTSGRTDLK